MKTMIHLPAVAALLMIAPGACFALWDVAPVTKELAKELCIQVRTTASGPDHVTVELDLKTEGKLKGFGRVDLRVGGENTAPLTAALREERPKAGRVVVRFTAARAQLDKITLQIMVPEAAGGSAYDLRVKDFVEAKKAP